MSARTVAQVGAALLGMGALCCGCVTTPKGESQISVARSNDGEEQPSGTTLGWHKTWWAIDGDVLSVIGCEWDPRAHQTHFYIGGKNMPLPYYWQEHHLLLQVQEGARSPPEGATYEALIEVILEWTERKFTRTDLEHYWNSSPEGPPYLAPPSALMRYQGQVKVAVVREDDRWRIRLFEAELGRAGHPGESIWVKGSLYASEASEKNFRACKSKFENAARRLSRADVHLDSGRPNNN